MYRSNSKWYLSCVLEGGGAAIKGCMLSDRLVVGTESERACELLARRVNDIRQIMLGACVCLYSGER